MAERKHFDDLWLSKEDLEHFRNVRALATLAEAGHPGINEEAARRYIVADMEILLSSVRSTRFHTMSL